jgi:hypothetical protein
MTLISDDDDDRYAFDWRDVLLLLSIGGVTLVLLLIL